MAGSGRRGWRVPGWLVGLGDEGGLFSAARGRGGPGEARFEGLRRRLESEAAAASATASGSGAGGANGESSSSRLRPRA